MFKKTLITSILMLCIITRAISQYTGEACVLKGVIKSYDENLMFVTIGILGENVGTVSDQNGDFMLKIPDELINQKLTVSHIGYETLNLSIDSLLELQSIEVVLKEKLTFLDEVNVKSKQPKGKIKEYGNTRKHEHFIWIQDGDKGSEIANLILPKSEIFLNSVSINIFNQLEEEFTLLLNIYTINRNTQMPDKQLLRSIRVIKSNLKKGWLEVPLDNEQLLLSEPFFVAFQWVNVDEPLPLIGGKSKPSEKSLIRYKALGTWERLAEWDIKIGATEYKTP